MWTPRLPTPSEALPGRAERIRVSERHFVSGAPMRGPFPGMEIAIFGMGCFWGAEKRFWEAPGVHTTAAGYAGGSTPNPTYQEVCSGATGHAEVVQVVFDPAKVTYDALLELFWEGHDPTQGMRQGADLGTQYRSAIYWTRPEQRIAAEASRAAYRAALERAGHGPITTEIREAPELFHAEDYHQQYLAKNPGGYCGHGGTGVSCPTGRATTRRSSRTRPLSPGSRSPPSRSPPWSSAPRRSSATMAQLSCPRETAVASCEFWTTTSRTRDSARRHAGFALAMADRTPKWEIARLRRAHDRSGFLRGEPALDERCVSPKRSGSARSRLRRRTRPPVPSTLAMASAPCSTTPVTCTCPWAPSGRHSRRCHAAPRDSGVGVTTVPWSENRPDCRRTRLEDVIST